MKHTLHAIGLSLGTAAAAVVLGCDAPPAKAPAAPAPSEATPTAAHPAMTYDELVALLAESDPFAKARKLGELLPTLGPESVPAVKEVLDEAAWLELGALEYELLMRYWSLHQPREAAWHALAVAPRAFEVAAVHATLRPFARSDPQDAVELARPFTFERGDAGAAAQIALVRGWYESGKPGLPEYIRDLGAGFERQRGLLAYANAVIRKEGVDAIVEWAESTPETTPGDQGGTTYRREVFRNVASALVPYDIEAAKEFCDRHCDSEQGSNMRNRIATRWARRDPAAALEWLSTAPEGQETTLAIRVSYAVWGNQDRRAAVGWMKQKLGTNANANWLTPSLPVYARLLGRDEPVAALEFAEQLADPKEREIVKIDIAREWRQRDEAAAEAWLSKSTLSAEALDKVRAPETRLEQLQREQTPQPPPGLGG